MYIYEVYGYYIYVMKLHSSVSNHLGYRQWRLKGRGKGGNAPPEPLRGGALPPPWDFCPAPP